MDHFLPCPCGDGVFVPEAAAGTTVQCPCGRAVRVPSFRELRERAGQPRPEPPPDMVIEALLLAGRLPEEHACLLCGARTDHSVRCRVTCERATVESGSRPWWQILLAAATLGWLGGLIAAADRRPEREVGKDRVLPLPLRVCRDCCAPGRRGCGRRCAGARSPLSPAP